MNLADVKDSDFGRKVRYTSNPGATVMEGELRGVDEDHLSVLWTAYILPLNPDGKQRKVKTPAVFNADPANVEFI